MKSTIALIVPLVMMAWSSCKELRIDEQNVSSTQDEHFMVRNNILCFQSVEDLNDAILGLKANDNNLNKLFALKTKTNEKFVSLRQYLSEQGLKNLSDHELTEIRNESLEYEPEDNIVIDPYIANILNTEREVQIKGDIWRFIDNGVIVYKHTSVSRFSPKDAIIPEVNNMVHGEEMLVTDRNNNKAKFIRINYEPEKNSQCTIYRDNGALRLSNDIVISSDNVKKAIYEKGGGSGSWLAKTASSFFGLNVSITNNFDKKHRMKLRMYEQDYIIYRAVGMTVRMQKRKFGIWWRKKAEEIRYGWTEIECEYKYKHPAFTLQPKKGNGPQALSKYPIAMVKKFPFSDSKVILFHIPYTNYDITTGNLNKVFKSGMKSLLPKINKWFKDKQNSNMIDSPRGLFTIRDNDKSILVVFPKMEKISYNTGRVITRWDYKMFSGNFSVGFSSTIGGKYRFDNINISTSKSVSIIRGKIYGAVKYDDEWRACVIETKQ